MIDNEPQCSTEELAHTSEIGLRARAGTLEELFGCLARSMIALTGADIEIATESLSLEADVEAGDRESLLVDWLNEVLYLHEVTRIVPEHVEVHVLTSRSIQTTLVGRPAQTQSELQIKAVTYHQLSIAQEGGQWKAEVFFDI